MIINSPQNSYDIVIVGGGIPLPIALDDGPNALQGNTVCHVDVAVAQPAVPVPALTLSPLLL